MSVTASARAASLTLAWDLNNDGGLTTGYFVYYGTTSSVYSKRVDAGPASTFSVTGLTDGTKYFFVVRAYDKNGVLSDPSLEVSAITPGVPPPLPPPGQRPQLVATVRADRYIDIAWSIPLLDPSTPFRVEVGTLPGFTAFSAVTAARSISFDMNDLVVPAYFVRVRQVLSASFGPASNEVILTPLQVVPGFEEPPDGDCTAPPGSPRRFFATALSSAVTLTWQRGVGDAPSGYVLEVGTVPGLSNLMTVPLGPTNSLSASASNGVYGLRLLATNTCGTSAWGAEATLTVNAGPAMPPGTPQSLTSQVIGRAVTLTWGAPLSGGAPTYYVIEATIGAVTYTFNTGNTATTASFASVPPGQYVVRVKAGNSAGTGPATATVTLTVF